MRYRSKPTEVEAMQWGPRPTPGIDELRNGAAEIVAWVNANGGEAEFVPNWNSSNELEPLPNGPKIAVRSALGRWAYAPPGYYVVRGARGFYPESPNSFEHRWEPIP